MTKQIADSEKKVLQEWVSGVDLSKVKIKTGFAAEALCTVLNAWAVTFGYNIYFKSISDCRVSFGAPVADGAFCA